MTQMLGSSYNTKMLRSHKTERTSNIANSLLMEFNFFANWGIPHWFEQIVIYLKNHLKLAN
jgi:hypothetical protein